MVTQITLKILVTLITLKSLKNLITMTTLTAKVPIKINEITILTLNTLITIKKTHNLVIIITLGLVCKSHTGQRELRIWSESMTKKKDLHWRRKQQE